MEARPTSLYHRPLPRAIVILAIPTLCAMRAIQFYVRHPNG